MNEKDAVNQTLFKDLYAGHYIICDSCHRRMGKSNAAVQDSDKIYVNNDLYEAYINGFLNASKDIVNSGTQTVSTDGDISIPDKIVKNRDLSIGIYYYLKNLWDKWLIIADSNSFDVSTYFNNNFVFTDSFYRNTYHELAVNCQKLLENWTQLADNGSLFHFLSAIVKDHHCLFLPVPDYVGFNGETQKHDIEMMEDLFRPLPYSAVEEPSNSNKFVVIYTYPSNTKDDDNGYKSDSYDIWSHTEGFTDTAKKLFKITNANDFDRNKDIATREGYNVPSFGISFGRQNNHIFKNLRVTMDNPVMTEQSIKALCDIAQKGSGGGRKVHFIGQDTFNVFSNYSYTIEVEMLGNAQICPLMYFQLMNIPMWRGTYMIYKVVHNMTAGNMTTTLTAMKMSKYCKPFNSTFFVYNPYTQTETSNTNRIESDCDDSDNGYLSTVPEEVIFRHNPNGWNLRKACKWLQENSQPGSSGACAKYVRMAIEKGGISTNGRPSWAWKYVNYLPTIGFKHILHHVRGKTEYVPMAGDIAVYKNGGRTDVPGHICMYTGVQWCSDFRQNSMYVYRTTTECDIYRFEDNKKTNG